LPFPTKPPLLPLSLQNPLGHVCAFNILWNMYFGGLDLHDHSAIFFPWCKRQWSWDQFSSSGSALFIKTKNHVRACPLLKHPCIHFIFAKIKQYTYKSHCFKIHFHKYTKVQNTNIEIVYNMCTNVWKCKRMALFYV
jgi:hypothetical protein